MLGSINKAERGNEPTNYLYVSGGTVSLALELFRRSVAPLSLSIL
jgi:hypothetical protein